MTKKLRTTYQQRAVTSYKQNLAESINTSRAKLSAHLATANAELNRIDTELAVRQSQLDVLRDGRERLAGLASQTAAQIAALDSVLNATK